jgi:hypothetical protein
MKIAILKNTLTVLLAMILLFSAVYIPKLKGAMFPVVFYLLFIASAYAYVKRNVTLIAIASNRDVIITFIWLIALILYSYSVSAIVGGARDFSIPYNYTVWLIVYIAPALVAAVLLINKYSDLSGIKVAAMIAVFQSVFIIAAVLFPEVKNVFGAILESVVVGEGALLGWEFRVRGFSGTGGATLALIQAIGASICLFLFVQLKKKRWLFAAVMIAMSILPIGRTGLIYLGLFAILFLPRFFVKIDFLKKFIGFFLLATLLLAIVVYMLYRIPQYQTLIDFIVSWGFKPFRHLGNISDEPTVKALNEMLFLPNDFKGYWFGSGVNLLDGVNLVGDPGYLRNFYYFGLIGVILHYGFFLWLMRCTLHYSTFRFFKWFVWIIYGLIYFAELKEPFMSKANTFLFFLFFYALALHHKMRHKWAQNACDSVENDSTRNSHNLVAQP